MTRSTKTQSENRNDATTNSSTNSAQTICDSPTTRQDRRSFLRSVAWGGGVVLATALNGLVAGCGGGGSKYGRPTSSPTPGATPSPIPSTTPTPTPTGAPPTDGAMTVAQRMTVLNGVEDFINGLGADRTPSQARQQVREYFAAQSVFTQTGISKDGCVWATFADGRRVIYFANRLREPGEPTPAAVSGERITRAASDSLPKNSKAYVLNGMGTYLPTSCEEIGAWLSASGYPLALPAGTEVTLDILRNVKGAGVFYLATHAGEGYSMFSITTMSKVIDGTENDPIIEQEMRDGLLDYGFIPVEQRWGGFADAKTAKVYCFTYKFIERYMTFAENSLVYMDACSSDEILLKDKAHKKGAGVYIGWTAPCANGNANRNARFIFDRLLGANKDDSKEDLAQRPFDYPAVLADLERRGWRDSSTKEYGIARMVFTPRSVDEEFGLLNPSIKYMDVSEPQATLTLTGTFGHDQGKVTVDGTELTIRSWGANKIVCSLPLNGPGSAGLVRVEVRGHKSNYRSLSEWRGIFEYDMTGPGTLHKHMTLRTRWRGDIGSYRDKPGESPKFREVHCEFTPDCVTSATGSGSHSDAAAQYKWNGELILPYFLEHAEIPQGANGFIGNVTMKPAQGKMELYMGGSGKGGGTTEIIPHRGGNPVTLDYTCYFGVDAFPVPIVLEMDEDGTIDSDTRRGNTHAEPFAQFTAQAKLEWNDIEPRFPPQEGEQHGRSR